MELGSVDLDAHATACWNKCEKILAFLQQTCSVVQSSVDTEADAKIDDDDDDDDNDERCRRAIEQDPVTGKR